MNHILEKCARDYLKEKLLKCTSNQQSLFKRMYAHKKLDASIDEVVDMMAIEALDWAMMQVEFTLFENLNIDN